TGDDISKAVKNLSGTAVASIELDHDDDEEKSKIKTIKGISKLFYWKWPVDDKYNGSTWSIPINRNEEVLNYIHIMPIYDTKSNSKFLKLKDIISIGQNERDEGENEMNNNPIVVISIPSAINIGFPLIKGWRSKDRMNAQNMYNELLKYVEAGDIEKEDVLQISTIHNWINAYASAFKQRATENELESEKNKL
ncbi:20395_t:CDS:2, partial [Gigaspora rosea]